ncbi:F0F1 ATP synthase subunit B, partial [Candidatus Daviesbacteria bacterium]|nr:F0F1 ATP synthase subunit B [Candidatus Daviesbacteria bacterium]
LMEILKDFGINPLLLAAQVVNFLVLLWILNKLLYKPILKVLNQRREKIEESLKNAAEIEEKLLKTEEDREKILAKASEEAQKLMDDTKKELVLMKEEGRQQVEEQAQVILRKGQEALRVEQEKMLSEARGQLTGLVMFALQKITGKVLAKPDQKKMVDDVIKELR